MSWQQNDIYNEAKREAEQERRRIAWRDWLETLAFWAMFASIAVMWFLFMGFLFKIIIN